MFATWRRFTARIGRWPRRLAALACLLMAGLTALAPGSTPPPAGQRAGLALAAGEVGVPVPLPVAGLAGHLHSGDRVGVVYAPDADARGQPALVADGLRVLSVDVSSDYGSDTATTVLLAAQRAVAVRLARFAPEELRLVMDRSP